MGRAEVTNRVESTGGAVFGVYGVERGEGGAEPPATSPRLTGGAAAEAMVEQLTLNFLRELQKAGKLEGE